MSALRSVPLIATVSLAAALGIAVALSQLTARPLAVDNVFVSAGADGLRVMDVVSPTRPTEVGAAPALVSIDHLDVEGGYVYAAEGARGLQVIDVSVPSSPTRVGILLGDAADVAVDGGFAYVANAKQLRVVDVSDPTDPKEVGALQGGAMAVAASGGHAYVATLIGMTVVDVSNPITPTAQGRLIGRPVDIAVQGTLVYLADPTKGLRVADVSEPTQPTELGVQGVSGNPQAVAVLGDRAYMASTSLPTGAPGGLVVFDVSDPTAPEALGTFPGDIIDVAVDGALAYVTTASGAFIVVDVSDPSQPRELGAAETTWQALRVALEREPAPQPTDTATPTETVRPSDTPSPPTDTPSPPPDTLTPTPSSSPTPTVTPSQTQRPPTATATPPPTKTPVPPTATRTATVTVTPFTPPTRVPGKRWLQLDDSNSIIPSRSVRFVAVDRSGRAWIRVASPGGRPDAIVVANRAGVWKRYRSLKEAIAFHMSAVLEQPFLEDFWSVGRQGRVWIGAEYFDGTTWHAVAADAEHPGGVLRNHQRVVTDRGGRAWVPFSTVTDCPRPETCRFEGLRSFGFRGSLGRDFMLRPVPEASRYGVRELTMIQTERPVVLSSKRDEASAPYDRHAPLQDGPDAWLIGRSAMYALPAMQPIGYPELASIAERSVARNSGYATAATVRPDGRLEVFTWVERHGFDRLGRRRLEYIILANTWTGDGWELPPDDLTTAPMFPGGVMFDRIVAAAYDSSGNLWVATASGQLGVRAPDGRWVDRFTAADSPLGAGKGIKDMAIGTDGAIWLATDGGLLGYGEFATPVEAWAIYVPWTEQSENP